LFFFVVAIAIAGAAGLEPLGAASEDSVVIAAVALEERRDATASAVLRRSRRIDLES